MGKRTSLKKLVRTVLIGLLTIALGLFVGCSPTEKATYSLETSRTENVLVYQSDFNFEQYFAGDYVKKTMESGEEFIIPLTSSMFDSTIDTSSVGVKTITIRYGQEEFTFNYSVKYKVDFMVDGEVFDSQLVLSKEDLDLSKVPTKQGYTFTGWEQVQGELTGNTQIQATFEENVVLPNLSQLSAVYGDTLNSLTLPSNKFGAWQFEKQATETVGNAGKNDFAVKFVLIDGSVFATDTIKINVAKKQLNFVMDTLEFEYDGEEKEPTYSFDGVDKNEVEVIYIPSYNGKAKKAGKYSFEYIIDDNNYEGEYAGEFTIVKKQVKVEIGDATMKYNEVVPTIAFSVKDKNGNDLEQKFVDELNLSLNAPLVSPDVGEYDIDITSKTFENFEVEVETGKLTVTKNVYNVDAIVNESQSIYGETLKNISLGSTVIDIGEWKWKDDSIVLLTPTSFTASVIFTPFDLIRYETIEKEVTFVVNKKEIEITIEESEYVYDKTQKSIEYSVTGLINNDKVEVKGNVEKTNAGTYDTILFIEDARYTAISKTAQLVINKAVSAEFDKVQSGLEEVVYHKQNASKLEHVQLPSGYTWEENDADLLIGENVYNVIFTPQDTDNYQIETASLSLVVNKGQGIISIDMEQDGKYVYNATNTYKFDATIDNDEQKVKYEYKYNGEETKGLQFAGNYEITVTFLESDHYLPTSVVVNVVIAKVENSDEVPSVQNATYLDVLGSYTDALPNSSYGTWKWVGGDSTQVGNAGKQIHKAVFTPFDDINYSAREIEIEFNVAKKNVEIPQQQSAVYNGENQKANIESNNVYEVAQNGGINVGSYDVVVSLKDKENYTWANSDSNDITLSFTITKATNSWKVEPGLSKYNWTYGKDGATEEKGSATFGQVNVVYYKGQEQLDSMPTNAGEYKVVFSVEDTANYSGLVIEDTFVIEKASVSAPKINSQVYTGAELVFATSTAEYIVTNGVQTNAGKYEVVLSLVDKDNYKWQTTSESEDIKLVGEITQADNKWTASPFITSKWTYGDTNVYEDFGNVAFGSVSVKYVDENGTEYNEIPTNAGSYKAIYKVDGNSNYTGLTEVEIAFTIEKASVTVPTAPISKVYVGETLTADVVENELYTIENNGGVNVGNYDVIYSLIDADNYKWANSDSEDIEYTFTITKATNTWTEPTISKTTWAYGEDSAVVNETGATFGQVTIAYYSGETLLEGMPTNAGSYKVVFKVEGNDNYTSLNKEIAFTIEKASVTVPTAPTSKAYTGETLTADVVENDLYTIENNGGINVGEYDVVYALIDKDNYKWANSDSNDITLSFTITKATNSWKVEPGLSKYNWTYGKDGATEEKGSATFGQVNVVYYKGQEQLDSMPTSAGSYKVVFKLVGNDNYTSLNKEIAFTIEKASVTTPSVPTSKVYTGETLTADIVENELYTIENNGGINVGNYDVIYALIDADNYKWANGDSNDIEYTFEITKATNTWEEPTISKTSWIYGEDSAQVSIGSATFGEIEIAYYNGQEKLDSMPTNAGSYKVVFKVEGNDNYTSLNKEIAFTIEKIVEYVPQNIFATYTGETIIANIQDTAVYTVIENNGGIETGAYDVKLQLVDSVNYKWNTTDDAVVTIKLYIETSEDNKWIIEPVLNGWIYGQTASEPHYESRFGDVEIAYYSGETKLAQKPTNAGSYKAIFIVEETENYVGLSSEVEFIIEKASVTVPTAPASKAYTGETLTADIVENELYTIENNGGINVGNYDVIYALIDTDNYKWANSDSEDIEYTFEITRATNTWTEPTISKTSWIYGQDSAQVSIGNATFGEIEIAYYNGQEKLDSMPTNAGSYKVVFKVEGNDNYTSLNKEIAFTIEKASVTVPTAPTSKVYTSEELKADVVENDLYTITNNGGVNVGNYDVVYALIDKDNYKWANSDSEDIEYTFTITKATNTWTEPTISKTTWIYGEDSAQVSIGNATFGEIEIAYYNGQEKLEQMPTNAGSYKVVFKVVGTDNYTGLEKEIAFIIEKASVTTPTTPTSKVYTGETLTADVVENDLYTIENNGGVNVGEYDVVYALIDKENYKWANGDSNDIEYTFTITKATNTWTEPSLSKTIWIYGEDSAQVSIGNATFGEIEIAYYNGQEQLDSMPANAGSYKVVFKVVGNDNYTSLNKEIAFTIEKASVTVPTAPTSKVYTGETLTADVVENELYTIVNNGGINVGNYDVIYALIDKDNYKWANGRDGDISYSFEITIADNEWTKEPTIADTVYGVDLVVSEYASKFGADSIVVVFEGINDTQYNSEVIPTNAGSYKATFTVNATSNYELLEKEITFAIEKASVTVPTASISKVYTGETLKADVVENELYTIENNGGINVGNYDVIYTLIDEENYKWSDERGGAERKLSFAITKATNTWTKEPSLTKTTWEFNQEGATISEYASTFGEVAVAISSAKTAYDIIPTAVGSYKIVFSVEGTDNYTGLEKEIAFTIEKATVTAPTAPAFKRYTGTLLKADVEENELYDIVNEGGVDIGEYDVIYTLKNPDNYKWSDGTSGAVLVRKFLIAKILNEWIEEPSIDKTTWVYGSTPAVINVGVASFGTASITYYNSKTNSAYAQMPTDVGSYYAILSIAEGSNYTGLTYGEDINNRIEFEITPFKLTITSAPTFNDNQVYENAIDVNSSAFASALATAPVLDINTASGTYSYTPIIGQAIGTDGKVNVNVNFIPSSANYSAPDPVVTRIAVKKVAYIGDNTYYGCIESAIMAANASTSTVEVWVVAGEKSAVIASNTTINSNVTLNIPHTANAMNTINEEDGSVTATLFESGENANDDNNAWSVINALTVVTIKSGVELTINGTLKVAGELSGGRGGVNFCGQTTGKAAKILMQANAKIIVKGTLNLFGVIIEEYNNNGSQVIVDGGDLYMPYVVRDCRGGTYMSSVYLQKVTPFNEWELRNITSLITVKNSANVYGYANLYASSQQNATVVKLVTTNNTEAIVHFNNNSGYLTFKYNISGLSAGAKHTNDSWQDGVMTIKIYGGAKTDPLEINAAGQNVSMKDYYFPFTWRMNVALYSGNYTMGYQYKLMPGAVFTVGAGANLSIATLSVYTQSAFNGVSQDGLPTPHYKTNVGDAQFIIENGGVVTVSKAAGGLIQIKSGGTFNKPSTTSVSTKEGKQATIFGRPIGYTAGSIKMTLSTKNI